MNFVRKMRILPALSIALPIALAAFYVFHDHSYQRGDESVYLRETQGTYLSMKAHGLIVGAFQSYLGREFRPIIHSFFAVPFLFLTGGKTNPAIMLYLLAFYSLFVFFSCRILAEFLEGTELALATIVVSLNPAIVLYSDSFRAELSLIAVFTAFLFYLKKSDFFASRKYSALAGAFLGLSICVRPIESLMYGGLLMIPALGVAIRRNRMSWRDLAWYSPVLGLAAAAFCYQQFTDYKEHMLNLPYLLLALLPAFFYRIGKKSRLSVNTWWFFGLVFAVPILWYGFLIQDLVGWIRWASFSDFARITGLRNGVSQAQFLTRVAEFASWPVLAAALIASLARTGSWKHRYTRVLFVLPAILVPPLLGSLSLNGDPKNYLLSVVIASIALLVAALAPGSRLRVLRALMIAVVALALVDYRFSVSRADWGKAGVLYEYVKGPQLRSPRTASITPEIYESLMKSLPANRPAGDIRVGILPMRQFNDLDGLIESAALTIISRERGDHVTFEDPYPFVRNTVPEKFDYVRDRYDYLIVFPVEHKPAPIEHFMSDVGELVLTAWKEKNLEPVQLTYLGRGQLRSESGNVGDFVLFQSLRKRH